MSRRCDICRGAKTIVLPVYRDVVMSFTADEAPVLREHARSFPCPQCSNLVQEERVQVLSTHREYEADYDNPDLLNAIAASSVRGLADHLLREGFVRVERTEVDPVSMRFSMSISIGFVHPEKVTSIEARIRENEDSFAGEVVVEAQRQIYNWASDYTGPDGGISKRNAANEVSAALRTITRRRKKRDTLQSLTKESAI